MTEKKKFLLHLKRGTIHLTEANCRHVAKMREANKKYFDTYEEAQNFYEGDKKGRPCTTCKPDMDKG